MLAPLLIIFAALAAMPAAAQSTTDCGNAKTQADMNQCAAQAFEKADAELNRVFQQLLGKLEQDGKGYARDAQRAWIAFRDKECVFRAGGPADQGGSIWPMIYAECRAELTEDRVKQLQTQVKCPGGDLSCPE
ncbi:lysozyme inhibitor LprI family protein [Rhodoligotrophos defluvii]|uniref:lysozyme inhibitor LprI family protein n=1 Tax=Rhodoligotrophos defluvii TaxID=2561934 RepID=UPI001EF06FC6|nr:lysozyme inhibitor LprI family protein [Rhodoligotrophos defluvii]